MRWCHLLVLRRRRLVLLLLMLLLLLLGRRRWINKLRGLHQSGDAGLGRRSFVLPRRCSRGHLVRHEPWTVARGGRIGSSYHGGRETSMMTDNCCLTRRLQIDGRRMTVHTAVQQAASGGIATRQGVVLVVGLALLLLASDASTVNTRFAPYIDILKQNSSPDVDWGKQESGNVRNFLTGIRCLHTPAV